MAVSPLNLPVIRFYSKLVRLKEVGIKLIVDTTLKFLFQIGSIKSFTSEIINESNCPRFYSKLVRLKG